MIYTPMIKKAINLAYEKHKNQVDKANMPYILHPIHVAEQMDDEQSTIVALLHDIVEDTDMTLDDLLKEGFSLEIIEALSYLNHKDNQDYFEYIKNLSKNEIAVKVKIEDLLHNSDLTRLDVITEDDVIRVKKYITSLEYLKQIQKLRKEKFSNKSENNKIY